MVKVAVSDVNVHTIEGVGKKTIIYIIGSRSYKFTRKYSAKALGNSLTSNRAFYPDLLFQRFLVGSKSGDPSLAVVLSYELSSHPAAFFEAKNILCTTDKPQIAQAISEYAVDTSCEAVMNCIHETDA
ncbi:hypothetical protein DPMN_129635 [Dreissena polymorpha]|uniref:Uncharacterized protein n=1 Tax=Dreissena polymorpha TaxID=45954 RepID=A0A9D4H1I9_DREPO|nr:hypothetical protein DPMN_129635 [Dreissena polymorpha]